MLPITLQACAKLARCNLEALPMLLKRCAAPLAAATLLLSTGCAVVQPVAPWQKGALAKPAMGFEPDRLEAAFAEHTYTSKEAASGGAALGGGGCGCN